MTEAEVLAILETLLGENVLQYHDYTGSTLVDVFLAGYYHALEQ